MSDAEARARALDAADDIARGLEPAFPVSSFEVARQVFDRSPIERTSYGVAGPEPIADRNARLAQRWRGNPWEHQPWPENDLPRASFEPVGVDAWAWSMAYAGLAAQRFEVGLLRAAGLDKPETDRAWLAPIHSEGDFIREARLSHAQKAAISLGLAKNVGKDRVGRTARGDSAVCLGAPQPADWKRAIARAREGMPTFADRCAELKGRAA
jgi:hypothetical protein